MKKGRPPKVVSDTLELVENTEAVMLWLRDYCHYNYEDFKRPMDEMALDKLAKTFKEWWCYRAEKLQQGLLYDGGDSKDMKGEDPSKQGRTT